MFDFDADTNRILKRYAMRLAIIMTVLVLSITACSYLNKKVGLDDDNIIEESVEGLIEYKTGLDIDLTPGSKE